MTCLISFKSNLAKRIATAKFIGFIIGLLGFFMLPMFMVEPDMMLRLGILFWYTTFGGIVGLFGFMDAHPGIPSWKFTYWFRGIFLGAWMNFVLVFFAYDKVQMLLVNMGLTSRSPFTLIIEGAIIGLIIEYFATKVGGEGKDLLK